MGIYKKIIWEEEAKNTFADITWWYENNISHRAAEKFYNGIQDTVHYISFMPSIGIIDTRRSSANFRYYSFLSKKYYRILYRYDETTVYIINIRDMRMIALW